MAVKFNAIMCLNCFEYIESEFRHDFKYCGCKNVFVDGGLCYCRRGFNGVMEDSYIELSQYAKETTDHAVTR